MKVTSAATLVALVLSGGVAIAQSSSGGSSSSTGSGAGSTNSPSTASPSTSNPSATIPSTSPSSSAPADPGNSSVSGPNAQSNTFGQGTVGQAPNGLGGAERQSIKPARPDALQSPGPQQSDRQESAGLEYALGRAEYHARRTSVARKTRTAHFIPFRTMVIMSTQERLPAGQSRASERQVKARNAKKREQAKRTGPRHVDQQGNRANVRQNTTRQGNRRSA